MAKRKPHSLVEEIHALRAEVKILKDDLALTVKMNRTLAEKLAGLTKQERLETQIVAHMAAMKPLLAEWHELYSKES